MLNINWQLIILPIEYFTLYELIWLNKLIFLLYDQKYYFFFEWIYYENNYILNTIKIKLQFLKLKEEDLKRLKFKNHYYGNIQSTSNF